jgi:hypothetical protein
VALVVVSLVLFHFVSHRSCDCRIDGADQETNKLADTRKADDLVWEERHLTRSPVERKRSWNPR